jgi:excisionase family DNA binding protein
MTEVIRPPPDPKWISILDAAALVGVSRRSIYNWLHAGKLTAQRTAGGSVRIETTSLWRAIGSWGRP